MSAPKQNTGPASKEACGFAALLHHILIDERRGAWEEVARKAGFSYDALYARMRGITVIRPEEAKRLIAAIGDVRLAQWFAGREMFLIASRPQIDSDHQSFVESVATAMRETVDVWEMLVSVTSVKQLSPKHRADVLREIDQAETAIANLRAAITA